MSFDLVGYWGRDNNQRRKENTGRTYSISSTWGIENQGAPSLIVGFMAASCENGGYRFVRCKIRLFQKLKAKGDEQDLWVNKS